MNKSTTKMETKMASYNEWCYQESADVATACGGLNTGAYRQFPPSFVNASLSVDGDWTTYGKSISGFLSYLRVNYTKPTNALSSSLWQVKDDDGIFNLTIPSSCWNQNLLSLILESRNDGSTSTVKWKCDPSSAWITIRQSSTGIGKYNVYEEAMWWNMPPCITECSGKCGGDDTCGGICPNNCISPDVCYNDVCCTPSCAGKTCGDDGCGGSCGTKSFEDVINDLNNWITC